jgi:hypothetical protein
LTLKKQRPIFLECDVACLIHHVVLCAKAPVVMKQHRPGSLAVAPGLLRSEAKLGITKVVMVPDRPAAKRCEEIAVNEHMTAMLGPMSVAVKAHQARL